MSDLDADKRGITSNAGRCDICGEIVNMDDGDELSIVEYGVEDDVAEEHGVTDQDAADAVADALERHAEDGADYGLAETIRTELAIQVHESCLQSTSYPELRESIPDRDEHEPGTDGGAGGE